jgi:tetratricopeptide (TPR) repeat protein
LHKDTQRRYGSAEMLAEDLERWLRGEPILARSTGRLERLWRWSRRNKATATLLGALALVMISSLAVFMGLWLHADEQRQQAIGHWSEAAHQRDQADDQRQQAVANLNEATRQRDRAERYLTQTRQVVDEFCVQLSLEDLRNVPGMQPVRKKLLEAALRYYQGFLQEQGHTPELVDEVAQAHFRVGVITAALSSGADALPAYEQAQQLYTVLAAREPSKLEWQRQLAACRNNISLELKKKGDFAGALAAAQEALALRQQVARDHPDDTGARNELARAWNNLGSIHHDRDEFAEAQHGYEQALAIREQLVSAYPKSGEYQFNLAHTHYNLGIIQRQTGKRSEALRTQQTALAILEGLVRARPEVEKYQINLAYEWVQLTLLHQEVGKYDEAMHCAQQALAIRQRLAHANPAVAKLQYELSKSYSALGFVQRNTKQLKAAVGSYRESISILEKLCADPSADPMIRNELAVAYRSAADMHQRLGENAEMRQSLDKAQALLEKLIADNPTNLQHLRASSGVWESFGVYYSSERPDEAIASYQKACAICENLVAANPANVEDRSFAGAILNNAGNFLIQQGRSREAVATFQKAIEHQRVAFEKSPSVRQYRQFLSNHYLGLATACRELGQPAAAAAATQRRQQLWPKNSTELTGVAVEFAWCIPLVGKGKSELTPEEQTERGRYADATMAALRQAVASGFHDAAKLRATREFAPLRDRTDFQQLLSELDEKAKPAMP